MKPTNHVHDVHVLGSNPLFSKQRVRLFCVLTLALSMVANTEAAVVFWTNSAGGLFSQNLNWSPNITPGAGDSTVFSNTGTYNLTVDLDLTNSSAFFHQGSITQAISSSWLLTNQWCVGETAGSTSRVYIASGVLNVTNQMGSGVLSVGRVGTGELAIVGGNVVTDSLLAENGSQSPLSFRYGSLTTLHDVNVNNGNALVVGSATNGTFTWNIRGGANQILNGGLYGYGGLTLGGGKGGIINLVGSNTSLRVYGLDTYGNNQLQILGGSHFQSRLVQLGLQTKGSNNLIIIADPGSAWINEYLMAFGMHSGAQTMIISNGGYFKTGGPTYGDQRFSSFAQDWNKIIITGSNSWFHSDGVADFGQSYSSRWSALHNVLIVTNGGRFWARQLSYGMTNIINGTVSRPGNLVDVAEGSLWIGSLDFGVGTLRIGASTGIIDQLYLRGGTNAVVQTMGNLFFGHHGNLSKGDLRIGGQTITNVVLNGELELGGWQIGAFAGDTGSVAVLGGRAFVTNASRTALLVVGGEGSGSLHLDNGSIQVDNVRLASSFGSSGQVALHGGSSGFFTENLLVNTGGTVTISNGATLKIKRSFTNYGTVISDNGTLQLPNTVSISGSCDVSSSIPFRIGDGSNSASWSLLGGELLVRSGLEISQKCKLTGSGIITSTVTNYGILIPETLAVQGDLKLDDASTTIFSLAGAPECPLSVTGRVALAGRLVISIPPNLTLDNSQIFVLLQASNITSSFTNVGFGQRLLTSDGLASFRIDNTGTAITASDFRSEDLNGDGIRDAWAFYYFGKWSLSPGIGADELNGDWDGDGLNNHDEFLLHTDPKDASSCCKIKLERISQDRIGLHFTYLPEFTYFVHASDDLYNWLEIPVQELTFDVDGLAVWDASGYGVDSKHFYHLLILPYGN
jgi:hypothetical protein